MPVAGSLKDGRKWWFTSKLAADSCRKFDRECNITVSLVQ